MTYPVVNKVFVGFLVLAFAVAASSAEELNEDEASAIQALSFDAKSIVKRFGGTLKPRLLAAIGSGGLDHAVEVCSVEAPQIAKALSEETGWSVKRVSLKPRNTVTASPDAHEQKVLRAFDQRQRAGESAAVLSHAAFVDRKFRFMKAQGVEGLCLNCHGKEISEEALKAIVAHYPGDIATGYSLGEVRGAFSLTKE